MPAIPRRGRENALPVWLAFPLRCPYWEVTARTKAVTGAGDWNPCGTSERL